MGGDRKVWVAMDFSKNSKRVLGWAINNLLDHGDTLIVLHVMHPMGDEAKNALWSQHALIPLTELREMEAMKKQYNLVSGIRHRGPRHARHCVSTEGGNDRGEVVLGRCKGEAVPAKEDLNLDSLVMGSRGLSPL